MVQMASKGTLFLILATPFFLTNCSHGPKKLTDTEKESLMKGATSFLAPSHSEASEGQYPFRKLWSLKLPGLVTDLSVSSRAEGTLIATIPDSDRPFSQRGFLLEKFNSRGSKVFSQKAGMQIKSLSLSDDGLLGVTVNYRDQVVAFNASGAKLWEQKGNCRPVVLTHVKKVICYNDDDSEPRNAFTVWNWKGKELFRFPIEGDVLALSISPDEKTWALGLTGGRLLALNAEGEVLWQEELPGEIAALAVSTDALQTGSITALINRGNGHPYLWAKRGELKTELSLKNFAQALEVSHDGSTIFTYSNTRMGQWVMGYRFDKAISETWRRGDLLASDYGHALKRIPGGVLVGYEQISESTRQSYAVAFSNAGELMWKIPLQHDEGAYLYVQDFAEGNGILVSATDDGRLSAYQIKKPAL
jgi:outer membrane protein assembly factor BamB